MNLFKFDLKFDLIFRIFSMTTGKLIPCLTPEMTLKTLESNDIGENRRNKKLLDGEVRLTSQVTAGLKLAGTLNVLTAWLT